MDDPKLVETFSRRQIKRLARFGKSRVPACRAVAASSALALRISADCGLPASHAAARELSSPAATQGRSWIMLN
jgi:hypothetical protein